METGTLFMKFLLISPPKVGVKLFIESPPIGLAYLGTAIRKLGHEVKIVDCLVEDYDIKAILEVIEDYEPSVVGINVFSTAIQSVQELIKKIEAPMVILGGPHITGSPESTFDYFPEADFAFRGEAEIGIKEFDEFLLGKREIQNVSGLVYRDGMNPPIEYQNIEEFDYPAWDLIDPRKYFNQVNVGDKSINVHFSRGCPFSCRFCVKLGTKVRLRSLEHIWGELEYLNKEFGVERFIINDEGYTMLPKLVKDFCRYTISKGNRFSYFTATGMRLNRLDDEMLELMKEARHELVFGTGIESAVPRVRQKLMNKQLTQDELERGLKLLNKHGFKPVGNFIIGFTGETRAELIQTVRWACKSKYLHGANFVPFLPLPGSQAVKDMMESGEMPRDYDFSKINLSKVVYAPKGMSIKELDRLRAWAVMRYNLKPRILWRYLSDWGRFVRAVVTFLRIYLPNFLLPKDWKRI